MPAKIHDRFSQLMKRDGTPMTAQQRSQLRNKAKGLCIVCGKPVVSKNHCLEHMVIARERVRSRSNAVKRINSWSYRLEAR